MNYINGIWQKGSGESFASRNPVTDEILWQGSAADTEDIHRAFDTAAKAQSSWCSRSWEERADILRCFAELAEQHCNTLAKAISDEVGKPLWDAMTEAKVVASKCDITIEAYQRLRDETEVSTSTLNGRVVYRPLGVVGVIGPFNFPAHIANGQIVPALLAGNSVIFKPSELTPYVAKLMVELWEKAGLPPGVLNLVQGGVPTSQAILAAPQLRGLFFTGSRATGVKLREALTHRLEVLLALELGGNNPLIVHQPADIDDAVDKVIKSAYLTSGQRCTCARRLILTGDAQPILDRLVEQTSKITVGRPSDVPEPFMGSLINANAVDNVLRFQSQLSSQGGIPLLLSQRLPIGEAFVSPGIIDVTLCSARSDEEVFGPLLQVVRVADLDAAIREANATQYGLAAGIVCRERMCFDRFKNQVKAGLINWNLPTTGASGRLPFGGIGQSGNYRPAGYHAINFCHVPIAEVEALPEGAETK
ncbi:succinylglutamate-semialdehyde dehydrogenase [Blastopirellula marina]|uniref:Succinylglutamate-semialdehyde dehydrogenase n=1 Tax=Blastopirellula marina TaxID=124 RepID=A0A2S8F0S3_9BACT|nr:MULTISPECIES: succinylglutamate-semialdehyde dehydrogenase [Pirellulaceae]PQO25761.1 succinylglutamate-semialdehyde dehydrogenase [Blastopirellula marina]RCS43444.1 succinylglutamate-semialdehyde dehydrogenase [Bremerella cremea]